MRSSKRKALKLNKTHHLVAVTPEIALSAKEFFDHAIQCAYYLGFRRGTQIKIKLTPKKMKDLVRKLFREEHITPFRLYEKREP
jgi:hypothetical protein